MNDLILIPGLGSDAAVWSRTISALGNNVQCRVGDTLHDDTLPGMAARILADAPATFALAGVSMGGMVALEIMRVAPERVTCLAIIDSNAQPDKPAQAERRRRGILAARAPGDARARGTASLAWLVHPDAPENVRDAIVEMGIRVGAETYARQSEAVLNRPDQRSVLPTIAVPTLVVMGAQDAMIPRDRAEEIVDAVPEAELAVIPDCGHLPPIEKPEALAKLLGNLISRADTP